MHLMLSFLHSTIAAGFVFIKDVCLLTLLVSLSCKRITPQRVIIDVFISISRQL